MLVCRADWKKMWGNQSEGNSSSAGNRAPSLIILKVIFEEEG